MIDSPTIFEHPADRHEIERRSIADLAARGRVSGAAHAILGAAAVLTTEVRRVEPAAALVFLVALLALSVVRSVLTCRGPGRSLATWRVHHRSVVLAMGATWGLFAAWTALTFGPSWTFLFVIMLGAGISAGSLTSLAPSLPLSLGFLALTLAPPWLSALTLPGREGVGLAMSLGAFAAFLCFEARHVHGAYRTALEGTILLERRAEELEAARAAADAANRTKDRFLANVSHEIRTPLNGIVGMAELLSEAGLAPDHRELLGAIQTSGDALLRIIGELLDVAKIEAGQLALQSAPFELRRLVHDAVHPFRHRVERAGVRLRVEVDERAPDALVGDAHRLRQLLTNLVSNAQKFTREGSITVRIEPADPGGPPEVLRFSVRDTGIGIAKDMHEAVMRPFVQVDGSLTRSSGGTGLGLAIARELARLMGGGLELQSEPGVGSELSFVAHLARPCAEPARERSPAAPPPRPVLAREPDPAARRDAAPRERAPVHLLLAEDNEMNRRVIGRMLDRMAVSHVVVENGRDAVARFRDETFDAIVMDVQMPEVDGLAATREIRRLEAERGASPTPIIALTAHAMKGDRERCLEAGMDAYLTKPVRSTELRDALHALIGPERFGSPATSAA